MTIEDTLTSIAKSLQIIADHITRTSPSGTVTATTVAPVAPVVATVAPAPVVAAPVAPAPVAAAPAMPAPPTFDVPVFVPPAAPVAPAMPFSDKAGLTRYVIDKYTKLGPQKGAEVGKIIQNLGFASVNEIPERSYKALFDALEALS